MHVGFGASGRNTGFLVGQIGSWTFEELFSKLGPRKGMKIFQFGRDAVDHVVSLVKSNDIDCDLAQDGFAFTATAPRHLKKLKKMEAAAKEAKVAYESWDSAACLSNLGIPFPVSEFPAFSVVEVSFFSPPMCFATGRVL